ncbi:hypothetical protein EYF80_008859 [Liparis tanakae]|uniref:Ig-like domain-containing protein n=1 Tax=Liparis tanakae TaxID=230148 RepID=A0A4Z2ITJ5_9TELE|nr:hypothetical protein EYF80_008859 [Liparis tanakae]
MRPNHRCTALHVFILAGLLLTLKADECEVDIKVPADTVYEAVVGKELQLNCTVQFCTSSPPPVSWYKSETTAVRLDYMAIPMVERPASVATGPQPLPRGSRAAPPSRRSGRGKTPPSQPHEAASPRGGEHADGRVREEVEGSLVYSALNHQLAAAAAAARPRRPVEAASEYAAIRLEVTVLSSEVRLRAPLDLHQSSSDVISLHGEKERKREREKE